MITTLQLTRRLIPLVIAVHLLIVGCSPTSLITFGPGEVPLGKDLRIASLLLKDGSVVEFNDAGGQYVEKVKDGQSYRAIVGMTREGYMEIRTDRIVETRAEQAQTGRAGNFLVGFLVGLPAGALVFYLILLSAYSR